MTSIYEWLLYNVRVNDNYTRYVTQNKLTNYFNSLEEIQMNLG